MAQRRHRPDVHQPHHEPRATDHVGAGQPAAAVRARHQAHVLHSQEKDRDLAKVAQTYSASGGHQVGDSCATVTVKAVNSGTAMRRLTNGWDEDKYGPRPDVWSPASSVWVTILNQQPTKDGTHPAARQQHSSIVRTPLVIAIPEPQAKALGWPKKPLGWADLAELSVDQEGWGTYDHPEWGSFKLGKTNPHYSTSGLNATIGAYFAATGLHSISDMTVDDIQGTKVRHFVEGIEDSIQHYGDISLTFLENLYRADRDGRALEYMSALTVEENSVIDYNRGNPTGDPDARGTQAAPNTRLVPIYPQERTMYSDHPYVPLTWMPPGKKAVADDFLRYLMNDAKPYLHNAGYRVDDGTAAPPVEGTPGLRDGSQINTLNMPAPEVVNAVLSSWSELRKEASVLLVIDKSGSMKTRVPADGRTRLDLAKEAAVGPLAQFRADDEVALWEFSSELSGEIDHRQLVPLGPMSRVRQQLKTQIKAIEPRGETGLYDTMAAAFEQMRKDKRGDAINAVVFLTDGKNEKRKPGRDLNRLLEVLNKPLAESVRIFTIGYGEEADQQVLKRIADATEAHAYNATNPDLIDEVFASVFSNF
ncbi:VWA domain-containing protein [Nonomuraea sp. LPB2021202275-12-8]|uniref:VWA domain-containing protein n=1 Tax=Nonomuraea sp. LPB2021202275-12-8 TaxID=3120159 RepID=UPI003FA5DDCE